MRCLPRVNFRRSRLSATPACNLSGGQLCCRQTHGDRIALDHRGATTTMRKLILCLGSMLMTGCAGVRVIDHSDTFAANVSQLPQTEVIENLDETVDYPFRIARRSTFGKGTLLSTDSAQASVAVPLHLFATTPGSVTGQAGNVLDSYSLDVSPEVDGVTLQILRHAYQAAVYPDVYQDAAKSLAAVIGSSDRKWLYWNDLNGNKSGREPEAGMWPVGRGRNHEFWVKDPEVFAQFVLLTYGKSAESNRASNNEGPGLVSIGPQVRRGRRASLDPGVHRERPPRGVLGSRPANPSAPAPSGQPGGIAPPVQSGDVTPPPKMKPQNKENQFLILRDTTKPPLSSPNLNINPQ